MLELDAVGFRYPGSAWVFRNVSLTVAEGAVTAVLGPNGRGKTTLIRCAAGLAKPQEGQVKNDGSVGSVPQTRAGAFAYRAIDMVVMGRVRQVSLFGSPLAVITLPRWMRWNASASVTLPIDSSRR